MANISGLTDPFVVKRDDSNGIATNGDDARYGIGGLAQASPGSQYGFASGVFPSVGSSGTITDLLLAPNSPASMQTVLNFGNYQVARSYHGIYLGAGTQPIPVTHPTANSSNPRWDYVIIRVRDGDVDTGVTRSADIQVLSGVAAASPIEPTAALTDGDFVVAAVKVRAGSTSIVATDISDRRVFVTAAGGITPKTVADTRDGSYPGQYRDNMASKALERWDGTAWTVVASPASWTQFTPRLIATGTGTDISIGTGATYIGRYQITGKMMTFNIYFKWGTAPYNGATGDIFTYLPTGVYATSAYTQWVLCHLYVNTSAYSGDFNGQAGIGGSFGTQKLQPMFPINVVTNNNLANYRVATTSGTTDGKSSVPNIFNPNGFPEGGALSLSGTIEIQ